MRNVSDKIYRENQNIHFAFNNFKKKSAVYEEMWKNIVERVRPQMKIWRMRIACWIPKATNTYSEYIILIAFPLQKLLQECSSIFRYAYIACLVS